MIHPSPQKYYGFLSQGRLLLAGGIVIFISAIVFIIVIGFGMEFEKETTEWRGTAPSTWDETNNDYFVNHYIWVEIPDSVTVEFVQGDEDNYFVDCEKQNTCATLGGFTFIGMLHTSGGDGIQMLHFDGEGDVKVISERDGDNVDSFFIMVSCLSSLLAVGFMIGVAAMATVRPARTELFIPDAPNSLPPTYEVYQMAESTL